ncbi:MAG: TldD/PmbA family protein [Armatimonadota bacterium]|nr:TldD/PmbA family protein [Armatimonadota bacterium]MDR7439550.1 TldD/PmbA family protein [Armatimonadota bacterium]MDR7443214.1 TldD/PmbA family protein [Armatimonadota bacterium]MDR7563717.1 TldD/PmbA family protein [Armatimonadota bacterium]MDR7567916.1 TldD/PmbA family protein [Armatimonadota bacterium]
MLGERKVKELLKNALARSRADETEVVLLAEDGALTRFANNTIHQNVSETNAEVAVRAVIGKHLGAAVTNRLDPEAIAQALARAEEAARLAPETPDFPGLPEPLPVDAVMAFDDAVASLGPEDRAREVREVIRIAESSGAVAAGALLTAVEEVAVANSKGVFCYHVGTRMRFSTVVHREDGSGYAERVTWRWGEVEIPSLARSAVERASRAQNPRELAPGIYPVLLDPYAVQDVVSWLGYAGAGALAVQEGRSWMNGRIGTKLLSERVTLWDDGRDPKSIPLPFDFEGVPRQRVVIVERGVPQGPVYDTVTAAREGKRSTGHALLRAWPEAASLGPLPAHLFLTPGDATVEELLADLHRGLYITRFWYTRLVHPRDCVVTGMTRDAVFWVEGGEIAYPVRNLRFTQGYVQALAGVRRVGRETWLLSDGRFGADRIPALLLEAFTFTGVTEY